MIKVIYSKTTKEICYGLGEVSLDVVDVNGEVSYSLQKSGSHRQVIIGVAKKDLEDLVSLIENLEN